MTRQGAIKKTSAGARRNDARARAARAHAATAVWRFWLVALLLVSLAGLLVGRLVLIQAIDQDKGAAFLKKQGAMRAVRLAEIPAYRGLVTDRHGEPLAVSTPVVSLWANPQHLADSGRLPELARALGVSHDELRKRLALYADKQFMYLARHQTPNKAREILDLGIAGVRSEREYRRFYPGGEVVAQLVGLTNVDGKGISGLEKAFDSWLEGLPGKKRYMKDLHGDAVRDIGVVEEPRQGKALALAIDLRLQYLQHRELQRAMAETGAEAGAAVTVDAWTGEILAITNHPVFNPNSRSGFDYAATRNRVMTDAFEPGSTIKPLTLVAALESGQFTIDTIIDTSPGRIKVGRKVLPDPRNYGAISVSRIIEKSSQVGVTKIAQQLGHEPILEVFRRFGLGQSTLTGFPGERAGLLPNRERWSDIEKVTLAFGYGLTATPLQMAQAYAVFANGGQRVPLSLIKRRPDEVVPSERVISPQIARDVLTVLERVTSNQGTARLARVDGYSVGGKTGTVHKVGENGYSDNQYLALFVGIAPMDNPRYVTTIVVDEPQGNAYGGGAAAAPIYARIASGLLHLQNAVPNVAAFPDAQLASLAGGQSL